MSSADRESRSSDPLPYVQVDRAVRTSVVGPLAGVLKTSPQHALGSLVTWWEMCGRPADLERIVEATPEGQEPEVVLAEDVVRRRFHLASGHEVEPELLVELGLLEPRDSQFRVRGMSRYFGPIKRRLQARAAAKLGGRARAGAERVGGKFTATGRSPSSQPNNQPLSSRPPADEPPEHQPTNQHSGQRTAVSGHTSSSYEDDGAAPSSGIAFFRRAQQMRINAGAIGEREPRDLSSWWSEATLAVDGDLDRLWAGWEAYMKGADDHWRAKRLPWAGFASQMSRHVPLAAPKAPPRPQNDDAAVAELRRRLAPVVKANMGLEYVQQQLLGLTWRFEGSKLVATGDGFTLDYVVENYGPALTGLNLEVEYSGSGRRELLGDVSEPVIVRDDAQAPPVIHQCSLCQLPGRAGPVGLPLCAGHLANLQVWAGARLNVDIWSEGWANTDEARAWLASARGEA